MKKMTLKGLTGCLLSVALLVTAAAPMAAAESQAVSGEAEVSVDSAREEAAPEQAADAEQASDEVQTTGEVQTGTDGQKGDDITYTPGVFTDFTPIYEQLSTNKSVASVMADTGSASTPSDMVIGTNLSIRGGDTYTFWGYKIDADGKTHKYDYSVAVFWLSGYGYTGKAIKPITLIYDVTDTKTLSSGNLLTEGKHYKTLCTNNKNASEKATLRIKGKGKFSQVDTAANRSWPTLYFTINKMSLTSEDVTIPNYGVQYKEGKIQKTKPTFMYLGSNKIPNNDFALTFTDESKSGAYEKQGDWKVKVTAGKSGNLIGSRDVVLTVSDKIPARKLKAKYDKKAGRTGAAIKPAVEVSYKGNTLRSGTDYTVSYANNVYAGTGLIIISGKGDFYGVNVKTFKIK